MRKKIVGLLLTVVLGSGFVAEAQQPKKVRRIGLFHVGLDHVPRSLNILGEGLKALGYDFPIPFGSGVEIRMTQQLRNIMGCFQNMHSQRNKAVVGMT